MDGITSAEASKSTGDPVAKRRRIELEQDQACNDSFVVPTGLHPNIAQWYDPVKLSVTRGLCEVIDNAYDHANDDVQISVTVDSSPVDLVKFSASEASNAQQIQITITNDHKPQTDSHPTWLQLKHFRQKPNEIKAKDPTQCGVLGVGLKHALGFFTYHRLVYSAESRQNSFSVELTKEGLVQVRREQLLEGSDRTTQTLLWTKEGSSLEAESFVALLLDACESSWSWLASNDYIQVIHTSPKHGQVARWRKDWSNKGYVFVQRKRYHSVATKGTALAYNLYMRKNTVTDFSKVTPPPKWTDKVVSLFKTVKLESADLVEFLGDCIVWNEDYIEAKNTAIKDKIIAAQFALVKAQRTAYNLQCQAKDHLEKMELELKLAKESAHVDVDVDDDEDCCAVAVTHASNAVQMALDMLAPVSTALPPKQLRRVEKAPLDGKIPENTMLVIQTKAQRTNHDLRKRLSQIPLLGDDVGQTDTDQRVRAALHPICAAIDVNAKVAIIKRSKLMSSTARWNVHSKLLEVITSPEGGDGCARVEEALQHLDHHFDVRNLTAKTLVELTKDDVPVVQDCDAVGPKFRPMLITDDWGSATGGMAALNYQLALQWASREDTEVFVVVTQEARMPDLANRNKAPRIDFVCGWKEKPDLSEARAATITTIIGHAPFTAAQVVEIGGLPEFAHCQKWLFLHTTPSWVDPFKGRGAEERVPEKNEIVLKSAPSCDKVLPVGSFMSDYWSPKLSSHKDVDVFQPQLNPFFLKARPDETNPAQKTKTIFRLCSFGRTDGVKHGKGVDMLLPIHDSVSQKLKETGKNVTLKTRVRGFKEPLEGARKALGALDRSDFEFCGFGSHEDVRDDLKESNLFLMTSLVEPFGLTGLEALAAGVLPLVSAESGLAHYLKEWCGERALMLIVPIEPKDQMPKRIEKWSASVCSLISLKAFHSQMVTEICTLLKDTVPNSPEVLATKEIQRLQSALRANESDDTDSVGI